MTAGGGRGRSPNISVTFGQGRNMLGCAEIIRRVGVYGRPAVSLAAENVDELKS